MAANKISPSTSSHPAILAVLAGLIEGNLAGCEALQQLEMLSAPDWLQKSVRQIEEMFSAPDTDWCGPMDEVVRKVQAA